MADRGPLCSASGLKISIRERHTARERRCGSIVVPIGRSGVLNRVIYANLACTSHARHRICASIFAHLGENELIRRFFRRQAIFQIDTVVLHSGLMWYCTRPPRPGHTKVLTRDTTRLRASNTGQLGNQIAV